MPSPKYSAGGVPPIWDSPLVSTWGRGPGGLSGSGRSAETYGPEMKQFQYAANMDEPGMSDLGILMMLGALGGQAGRIIKTLPPADALPGILGTGGIGAMAAPFAYQGVAANNDRQAEWKSLGPSWSQEAANEQLFGPRLTIMNILSALGRLGQRR